MLLVRQRTWDRLVSRVEALESLRPEIDACKAARTQSESTRKLLTGASGWVIKAVGVLLTLALVFQALNPVFDWYVPAKVTHHTTVQVQRPTVTVYVTPATVQHQHRHKRKRQQP